MAPSPRIKGLKRLACPFFMPERKLQDEGAWFHPSRLPLGNAWDGHCGSPGYEATKLSRDDLRECNLGYATACPRLPKERACDAVRFSVTRDMGSKVTLCFVCEASHQPREYGTLQYDLVFGRWVSIHPDSRLQRMAECYLESYLQRRTRSPMCEITSSTES